MNKYNLSKINGFITEEEGIYILNNADGSSQMCTKKEIDFYGGVLVVQDLNSEIELQPFKEEVIEEPKPAKKKVAKKKVAKKNIIKKLFNK